LHFVEFVVLSNELFYFQNQKLQIVPIKLQRTKTTILI